MKKPLHIVWVGGGTVGHIAPLVAALEATHTLAAEKGIAIRSSYIGQDTDVDSPTIKAVAFPIDTHVLKAGKLHRHLTFDQFRQTARMIQGLFQARRLMRELKPDLVFAKGGYVCVPVAMAARALRIPIFTHETDAKSGLTNKITAKSAERIFTSFPIDVHRDLPKEKLREVGQPVRDVLYKKQTTALSFNGKPFKAGTPLVFIFSGSQGGRRVNVLVQGAWERISREAHIVHITGPNEHHIYEQMRLALPEIVRNRVMTAPFMAAEFPAWLQQATVVICRAGGSFFELAAAKKASILLPLSTAAQNHQWANAAVLQGEHAAIVLDELSVTSDQLAERATELLQNPQKRADLEKAIARFDHPHAAEEMAAELLARMTKK